MRQPRSVALKALSAIALSCTTGVEVGSQRPQDMAADAGPDVAPPPEASVDARECIPATCRNRTFQCGDCMDNDADGLVDMEDPECVAPCDDAESSLFGRLPGPELPLCTLECYFDPNLGAGNDRCFWSQTCDPLAPAAPNCAYDPVRPVMGPGGNRSCDDLLSQSETCQGSCAELTPNGCDCFGCCRFANTTRAVWLGSLSDSGEPCTIETLDDPLRCRPCTQVESCMNPCDDCEQCVGMTSIPATCP